MHAAPEVPKRKRQFTRKGIGYWAWSVLVFILATLAARCCEELPELGRVRNWGYEIQMKLNQHGPAYPRKTAVVEIGDHDFWGADFVGRQPIRADRLAEILDRLREGGVNTVVLDVDLRSPIGEPRTDFPEYSGEDEKLTEAIARMCSAGRNIVLGASVMFDGSGYQLEPSRISVSPGQLQCVHWGYMQLPEDQRRVPGKIRLRDGSTLNTLALATLSLVDPTAADFVMQNDGHEFRFGRFLTEDDFGPRDGRTFRYSWSRLKDADINDVRHDLADRVVLVGGHWSRYARGQGPPVDQYDTPAGPMSGVFLHANYIEALVDNRDSFAPMPVSVEIIIDFLLWLGMAILGSFDLHIGWKWGAIVGDAVILCIVAYLLLKIPGIYIDLVIGLIVQGLFILVDEAFHVHSRQAHLTSHFAGQDA